MSNVPGLVAQMDGRPTSSRYKVVTVFVDQATGFSCVHFQKTTNAEETVAGKEPFECQAASMGHKIQHYHADNSIFASKIWRAHCISKHQGLSFTGIGAHHQNGVAENKIRLLQSQARTMLIHAAKSGLAQSPQTSGLMPSEWQMSPLLKCPACNSKMDGLPSKHLLVPEPQQIQSSGNPLLVQFTCSMMPFKLLGGSTGSGKIAQELVSIWADLHLMHAQLHWSSISRQDWSHHNSM